MTNRVTSPFSFGKNWQGFLESIDEERHANAEASLAGFLGRKSLEGMSFLDIGCGSGLFSRAALKLGAEKIVSFDVDPFSVECCRYLHREAGEPPNWKVLEGSVLDREFTGRLGTFDIVYSWGVLHHTGRMWEAIANAAGMVRAGGYFYIAIYNRVPGVFGSGFWLRVKKAYNALPGPGRRAMEAGYMAAYCAAQLARGRSPRKRIAEYKSDRGMDWKTDITDWLGGYPYEYATAGEILEFMERELPSLAAAKTKRTSTVGNNWFLFKKKAAAVSGGGKP